MCDVLNCKSVPCSSRAAIGIGGEVVSIAYLLNVARVYAAPAVDTCSRTRDELKLCNEWAEAPA